MFKNKKILIAGASSDLAVDLNEKLYNEGAIIGFHYNRNEQSLSRFPDSARTRKFQKNLDISASCRSLVDEFVDWAGNIDILIQLCGDINRPAHWENLTEEDWRYDLSINLVMPFFLAQRAIYYMKDTGGRILLTSTASAVHGGGSTSLAYGTAKAGIECIVKRLAKDCAKSDITVNAIAPGFVITKFHTEKLKKTREQLRQRTELIPLKRAGTTREVAEAIMFLISEKASYITGQNIAVSGGDWL